MAKRILVFLRERWWLFVVVIFISIGIGIYLQTRPEVVELIEVEISAAEGLEYELVQETADSCWVIVKTPYVPSETQLKAIAFRVWTNKGTPNIFLYLPEMNTSGAAYAVAKFISQGLKEFRINPSALSGTKWEE